MQKLINLLALLSFGVSAAVVGGGAYLYLNKDALVEDAKEKVTKAVTDAVTEASWNDLWRNAKDANNDRSSFWK